LVVLKNADCADTANYNSDGDTQDNADTTNYCCDADIIKTTLT